MNHKKELPWSLWVELRVFYASGFEGSGFRGSRGFRTGEYWGVLIRTRLWSLLFDVLLLAASATPRLTYREIH